jgi:hypothetical protein
VIPDPVKPFILFYSGRAHLKFLGKLDFFRGRNVRGRISLKGVGFSSNRGDLKETKKIPRGEIMQWRGGLHCKKPDGTVPF